MTFLFFTLLVTRPGSVDRDDLFKKKYTILVTSPGSVDRDDLFIFLRFW